MKRLLLTLVSTAVFAAADGPSANAQDDTSAATGQRTENPAPPILRHSCRPPAQPAQGFDRRRQRLDDGDLQARECALEILAQARDDATFSEGVRRLSWHYARRAERQQTILDVGATGVGVGALGYGTSGRVGASTQSFWGYGMLLSALLTEWNANEPTRDLFHAGEAGIAAIAVRRDRMNEAQQRLRRYLRHSSVDCSSLHASVRAIIQWNQSPQRTNAQVAADRSALLPEAERLANACHSLSLAHQSLEFLALETDGSGTDWSRRAAHDVLRLDRAVLASDRELRNTPSELFRTIVSLPLKAIEALISGNERESAVKERALRAALEGLNMTLWSIPLPEVPSPQEPVQPLSAAALARTEGAGLGSRQEYQLQVQTLQLGVASLRAAQARHAQMQGAAEELRLAAAATELTFQYVSTGNTVRVELRPPATAALVTTSTP